MKGLRRNRAFYKADKGTCFVRVGDAVLHVAVLRGQCDGFDGWWLVTAATNYDFRRLDFLDWERRPEPLDVACHLHDEAASVQEPEIFSAVGMGSEHMALVGESDADSIVYALIMRRERAEAVF